MEGMTEHGKVVEVNVYKPNVDPRFSFISAKLEDGEYWEMIHDPYHGWLPWETGECEEEVDKNQENTTLKPKGIFELSI